MEDGNNLTAAEAANFGNSAAAESPEAFDYVANFEGDEIDGTTYAMGDKIADGVDAGTLAFLVQNGRITAVSKGSGAGPSGGSTDGLKPSTAVSSSGSKTEDDTIALNADEQAEADQLVADNSAADLQGMLPEGASKSGSKADLAARIIAGRR